MMSKFRKSVRDIGAAAMSKINELQEFPDEIPEDWEEKTDNEGKKYYVDVKSGEWYRIKAKEHRRIDTNEKISIITTATEKEFKDMDQDHDHDDDERGSGPALQSASPPDNASAASPASASTATRDSIGNTPSPDATPSSNGNVSKNDSRRQSKHTKRGSTSIGHGWRCEQCTLENPATNTKCNACLGPRPTSYDPDDDNDVIDNDYTSSPQPSYPSNPIVHPHPQQPAPNALSDEPRPMVPQSTLEIPHNASHRQMNTMEQINAAMSASLDAVLGDAKKELTEIERRKLMTFMDFTTADVEPSIKYLKQSGWDPQDAADEYWKDHPEKAASRPGSLIFNQNQLDAIHMEPTDFEADIHLPGDIALGQGNKRRGSNEMDPESVPDGVRPSDDEEEEENVNEKPEEKESEVVSVQRNGHALSEHAYDDGASESHEDDGDELNDGVRSEQPHVRMDTGQMVLVATEVSKAQLEFDHSMEEMRAEKEELERRLEEVEGERDALREENHKLKTQSTELQGDWDRMNEYMNAILDEVRFVEDQRRDGKSIATPTEKLQQILAEIRDIMQQKGDEHQVGVRIGGVVSVGKGGPDSALERDLYAGVSQLFASSGMEAGSKANHLKVGGASAHAKGLSFGAVDSLFADEGPILDVDVDAHPPSSSSAVPSTAHSGFLHHGQHEDNRKNRLSYGGVESLFSSHKFVEPPRAPSSELREDHEMEVRVGGGYGAPFPMGDALGGSAPLSAGGVMAVSFEPTYDGIATLFEEPPEHGALSNQHLKKATIGGDIVEMFIDHALPTHTDIERGIAEEEEEVDDREPPQYAEEEPDSMDEQTNADNYTYDTSDDDSHDKEQDSHSDPTPLSQRDSKDKRHSRGPSFQIKDIFKGDSDGDDRAPSVQSAPEDIDDYYAISAYYGIDDEDTWNNSRRSSLFGDYGRITSRRQSKRMVGLSTSQEEPIKKLFADRLVINHSMTGSTVDQLQAVADVADLFQDFPFKKSINSHPAIAEHDDEGHRQMTGGIDDAEAVADLFQKDHSAEYELNGHKKEPTYSGVRQMFGSGDDGDDDDDDYDSLAVERKASGNLHRPSSKHPLSKTFDALSLAEKQKKEPSPTQSAKEEASASAPAPEPEAEHEPEALAEPKVAMVPEEEMERRIESVRKEERQKMSEREEEMAATFKRKEEGLTASLNELEEQIKTVRSELTEALRPEIREESRKELRAEMESEIEGRVTKQVDERMETELKREIEAKMDEMKSVFEGRMSAMERAMEEEHRKEVETMERSKYELIQHTAKEIDSLRRIIQKLTHFQQSQQSNGNPNLQLLFQGLMKWT